MKKLSYDEEEQMFLLFFMLTCPVDFLILPQHNAGSYSFHHFAAPNFYLFQRSAGGIP